VSLLTERVTLHLRGQQTGEDPMGDPIYSPPTDVPDVPAWWEPAGSSEDLASAAQVTRSYWLYTEDTRITAADAVTLHGPVDVRAESRGRQLIYAPREIVVATIKPAA
jgi:hypothetical protein